MYGAVSTLARAVPLLTLIAASTVVPAADFGVLAGLVATFTLCIGIAEGGLDSASSLLIGDGASPRTVLSSLLVLRWLVAAGLALVVLPLLILPLGLPRPGLILLLAAVGLVLASTAATCRVRVRVRSPRREMGVLTADRLVSAVPFLAGLVAGADVQWLMLLFLLGQSLGSLLTVALVRPPAPGLAMARTMLVQAFPFIVSTAAANATWRAGVISLGMHGAHEEAGYLAMAIYPVQALVLISAGSAPLVLLGGRKAADRFALRTDVVLGLVGIAGALIALTLVLGPWLPVEHAVVITVAILLCVLPAALMNPLVGAARRVRGRAGLVSVAALSGSTVVLLASLFNRRAAESAAAIVMAEIVVLTIMLAARERAEPAASEVA